MFLSLYEHISASISRPFSSQLVLLWELDGDEFSGDSYCRCVKLTNVSSCAEIMKWSLDSEAWSVCWNADDPAQFFVGTKRSKILVFDTR